MKKLFFSLLLLSGMAAAGYAQTDVKAKAILADVSKKYKSFPTVKSEFTFTLENQQSNLKEVQQGTLYARAAANKYKVVMTDQDVLSDGKTQWTYLKKDKEVQVSEVDQHAASVSPAKIFTLYEQGFKYQYTGDKKEGSKVYQMIDLTPTDGNKSYFKVRLSIDKAAKQIANVLIFDKNGNKYNYRVKSFVQHTSVPESTFTFDARKYPGVEVVDLR